MKESLATSIENLKRIRDRLCEPQDAIIDTIWFDDNIMGPTVVDMLDRVIGELQKDN